MTIISRIGWILALYFLAWHMVWASDLTPQVITDVARALRSPSITDAQRQEGLKTLQESFKKLSHCSFRECQKFTEADVARAQFEIEQLEVFMRMQKCKSDRNLAQSVLVGASAYDPCIEGQQEPYAPGNQNLWDLNRTVKNVSGIDDTLREQDLFRKRAYHRAVTNAVKNLITLEIEETGRHWSLDEIQGRASLLVKENCKNCTALDTRLITAHVARSIKAELKTGMIKPQSFDVQIENVCTLLKKNGYEFVPPSLRASGWTYLSPIGKGREELNEFLNKRIQSLNKTLHSGRESLLILTHAMTDLSDGQYAHIKLKCMKVAHRADADRSHNHSILKSAYAEAESNVKKFLALLKKEMKLGTPTQKEIDQDIELLTKLAPRAVGEALYEQSSQSSSVCQAINRIQKDDDFDETVEEVKLWGSVVAGVGLTLTGVFAPAGATVMGASLSMSALVAGTALGAGVGAHDWYASGVMKEDSEILKAAAIASGSDPNLAKKSGEEWEKFESLRLSAMINLGMSAFDVSTLALPLLKSGKRLKDVNHSLEKMLLSGRRATPDRVEQLIKENKLQEAAWSLKEAGRLNEAQIMNKKISDILQNEEVIIPVKELPSDLKGSAESYIASFKSGSRAIFKPDAPNNPMRFEILASDVDEYLDLGIVPKTVKRTISGRTGSLQYWVDDTDQLDALVFFENQQEGIFVRDEKMVFLDYIFRNPDRGTANFLVRSNSKHVAIDHGKLTPLQSIEMKGAGAEAMKQLEQEIPRMIADPKVSKILQEMNLSEFESIISRHLTPDEVSDVMKRVRYLQERVKNKAPQPSINAKGNSAALIEKDPYPGISLEKAKAADLKVREQLDQMGIKYVELPRKDFQTSSNLTDDIKDKKIKILDAHPELIYDLNRSTALYQVRARDLTQAGKTKDPLESAFMHEKLPEYLKQMEEDGYRLVVDSSLPISRMGGYFSPAKKVIALRPESKWITFAHEYQHYEFDQAMKQLKSHVALDTGIEVQDLDMNAILLVSKRDPNAFAAFTKQHPKIQEVFDLYSRTQLTELGLNETLAVRREIELLEKRGYTRLSSKVVHARKYALDHQINEIKKLENATTEQAMTLLNARAEKALLLTLEGTKTYGKIPATLGAALVTPLVIVDEKTRTYLFQKGKEIVVVSIDNISQYLKSHGY